ncbi:hypothetical protein [Nostoc sp. 'Lobaria pulmonaria (5183) cyanobiont']|uniref:hypothetical protein n=1 Tax=Nostoc sp. 'Lobaria pulmonaria (5183) cyanobiont' TaxID=1618022 RepID=UPI000CF30C19|nr:hypothetical protein [Nostoc sp. 'Lobaria pulmonaria (5183) cyanobiont']AVH72808.1 hypothetical protein NLP_4382 [Nostoc sp. 'Lobaria pulmonaria (5183) cyanobiont']
MLFNKLLLSSCLLPGKTSYTENGVEINIKPSSGETILFFLIDNQSNPNCKLRQILGLEQEGMKICDLIVFYAKESKRIICFVELKGGDVKTATEQVITTYTYFKKSLKQSELSLNFIAKAYIKSNSSVPQEIDKYKQELKQTFGEGNYDISKNSDLGNFLRGVEYQPKGKSKKK